MTDVFQIGNLQRALDYHAERHNVVASNIANANTPGFRPVELLRAENVGGPGATLPLARTAQAHMGAGDGGGEQLTRLAEDKSTVAGLDGNSVSLEREMAKLSANDLRYQGAAKLVTRQMAMLRYAASDGSGG
jgi:flagellar basal-body rod protein FlgB